MKKVLQLISIFFFPLWLAAQQKAEKALHTLDEKYPQEKIHLFLNKEAFNAGETPTQLLDEKLSSVLFTTGNNQVIDFVNEQQTVTAYSNVFDWLDGRVAGLNFKILTDVFTDPFTGIEIPAGQRIPILREGMPIIFLDEIQTDANAIHTLPVTDIAMVKVFKGYFLGAPGGGGSHGALAIYTKRAMQKDKSRNMSIAVLEGYIRPLKASNQPFYWNCHPFETDSTGAGIIFYDGEVLSTKRLVITGFMDDARPIFYEKILRTTPQ